MALFSFTELILLITTIALYFLYRKWSRYRNFPPGPWGIPILGYLPFVGENVHEQTTELGRKYGRVYSISLGTGPVVMLNDYEAVHEAFLKQSETFASRPEMFLFDEMTEKKEISMSNGLTWKLQRRFALHQLRDFGFGKKSMEAIILEEVDNLVKRFEEQDGQKIPVVGSFYFSVLNVIWGVVSGKKFKFGDPKLIKLREGLVFNLQMFETSAGLNFYPFLRFFPPFRSQYKMFQENTRQMYDFLASEVEEHVRTYKPGEVRDFTDAYLNEIETGNVDGKFPFDKSNLTHTLNTLFTAGADTSANTLTWALLYMAVWPDIQTKVQDEMDLVIGRDNLPSYEERRRLPYTEATVMEIYRKSSIANLAAPHATNRDTSLFGYDIPKGTTIMSNLWAVHHDPKYWEDPEVFRPERFLKDGVVQKPDSFIPFGLGARSCLGESLARMEIYLFFTCLLHRFTFRLPPGEPLPDMKPKVGITLVCKPFNVIVQRRR